jgi:hypothetical protein
MKTVAERHDKQVSLVFRFAYSSVRVKVWDTSAKNRDTSTKNWNAGGIRAQETGTLVEYELKYEPEYEPPTQQAGEGSSHA